MNLYKVQNGDEECCVFVFAKSRGRAKVLFSEYFEGWGWGAHKNDLFLAARTKLMSKDVGGSEEVCDEDCRRLAALGICFLPDMECD
jgi:hypothetical protein